MTREAAARFVISSCCCRFHGGGFGIFGCRISRGGAAELEGIIVSWGFVSFTRVAGFAPSSSSSSSSQDLTYLRVAGPGLNRAAGGYLCCLLQETPATFFLILAHRPESRSPVLGFYGGRKCTRVLGW